MAFSVGGMMNQVPNRYARKTDMPERKAGSEVSATGTGKSFSSALSQAAVYESTPLQQTDLSETYRSYAMSVKKNSLTERTDATGLSEKAQALLEELQAKYDNMDFYIASVSSDEEAYDIMSQSTKEYSVLIDPETLEQMARDEEFKEKCMGNIEASVTQMTDMFEQLGEEGAKDLESVSMKLNADGTVEFFARLREAAREQAESIKEAREEDREAQRKEKAEEEKENAAEKVQEKILLRADSMEALLAQIRERNASVRLEEKSGDVVY